MYNYNCDSLPSKQKFGAIHAENRDQMHPFYLPLSAFAGGWCSFSYILTSTV
uniref:Uncharacterized protein n=1 Tax=Arundo donax TaxID=35708 RepID=A0A0A9EET5_ARUDO